LGCLNLILEEKLYGVYLYGAVASPEGGGVGDVDFHVILREPPDEEEKVELEDLHVELARDYPPLGGELDGYYILLQDARGTSPPEHQWLEGVVDRSWALHREHILAGRCIVLQGPDPSMVYPPTTWPELEGALQGELDYVQDHLDDYPAYCVLNLCRLMVSHQTRDVVISKRASASWAREAYPEWRQLIDAAERTYDREATAADEWFLQSEVGRFFEFARRHIQEALDRGG
jgi:hypothetical protein